MIVSFCLPYLNIHIYRHKCRKEYMVAGLFLSHSIKLFDVGLFIEYELEDDIKSDMCRSEPTKN